jgi:hypothetical protein
LEGKNVVVKIYVVFCNLRDPELRVFARKRAPRGRAARALVKVLEFKWYIVVR